MNENDKKAYEQAYDEMISMGYSENETKEWLDWKFNINQ